MFSRLKNFGPTQSLNSILAAFLLLFLNGCFTDQIAAQSGGGLYDPVPDSEQAQAIFSGGNGSSLKEAVIVESSDERTGVRAEYVWLHKNYSGYLVIWQTLHHGSKMYDELRIKTREGRTFSVYFDITSFYGKIKPLKPQTIL